MEDFIEFSPEQAHDRGVLREIALKAVPNAEEKVMYGGIVFVLETPFCGIFVRKQYITLELSGGPEMGDPENLLEGSGKQRRHLKIANREVP